MAVVTVSSAIGVEVTSTPFDHNLWEASISGNLGSTTSSPSAFFISPYTQLNRSLDMSPLYQYNVEAFNITQGNLLWESQGIKFYGKFQFESSNFRGPMLWYSNNIVYLLGYNFLLVPEQNLTTLTLYAFNATNGNIINQENLTAPWASSNNRTNFAGIYPPSLYSSFNSNSLFLYYLVVENNLSNFTFDKYFQSISYSLKNGSASLGNLINISLPGINSYGTGSIKIVSSDNLQIIHLQWINGTIVENLNKGDYQIYNMSVSKLNIVGNKVFTSQQSSGTVTVYSWNSAENMTKKLFSFDDNVLSSYPKSVSYSMSALQDGHFVFVVSPNTISGNSIPVNPNPDIQFMGYAINGTLLWNVSVKPNSLGTIVHLDTVRTDTLLLSTYPPGLVGGSYHSAFVIVNYSDGKVLWKHTYGYSMSEPSGNGGFLSPTPFYGVDSASNGYVLYNFGPMLACAYLGNL